LGPQRLGEILYAKKSWKSKIAKTFSNESNVIKRKYFLEKLQLNFGE
jgi:hypothetical protein